MQPPVKGKRCMGLDPGYRMGCKVAVVDPTGKVLDTGRRLPHHGERWQKPTHAQGSSKSTAWSTSPSATARPPARPSRWPPSSSSCRRKGSAYVSYMIVSEAGASVYSASKLAAEEFPEYDVNLRSAVSIARQLAGPAGRAGEDRPQGHRRRPVSARYARKSA